MSTDIGVHEAADPTDARRVVVPGIALVAVTYGLARYGYGLLLPQMRATLRLDAGTAGLISSATYLTYLAANVGVVMVINRRGPRLAVALAGASAVAGMAVIAAAQSAAILAVGVLVGGAAAGFALPPYADMVASRVAVRRRDAVWSAISSGTGWGVALAGPIAIVAGQQWRLAWISFVAVAVLVAIPAVLRASRESATRGRAPQLSWTWFFCPKSRPLLLSSVLLGVGSSIWWAFSVDALQVAGVSPMSAKIVYAVCGAASIVASFSGAAFARVGLRAGYLASSLLLAGSLLVLALTTASVAGALCAAVLFGVFYNAVIAAGGIWSVRVFGDHPAAGLAAYGCALTVGTLIGPTVAGFAIDGVGYRATLLAAAAVVALAMPFCPPSASRRAVLREHICRAAPVKE